MADNAIATSHRDVVKAINATFSTDSDPAQLPEELQRIIEDFLESHKDSESDKLQEELVVTYNKYAGLGTDKQPAFANLLRLLLPAISNKDNLDQWWTILIRPTLDTIWNKRNAIDSVKELLLSVLVQDRGDGTPEKSISAQYLRQTLDAYFARTKIPTDEGQVVSPEDEFIAHEWEKVLVAFGKQRPKELLLAMDGYLMKGEFRLQTLSLLSSFVRLQTPHLHLVLETSLIQHLLNSLLIDTSPAVVDLALTVLIMFIPHITSSLVDMLPKLFLTYARVICWDQYYKSSTRDEKDATEEDEKEQRSPTENGSSVFDVHESWEQLQSPLATADAVTPQANYLFTFLYGLFPLNFMSFIRKPRRYLKAMDYPRADDLDLRHRLIRSQTEAHRTNHLLHPSFFTTTVEDELRDNRWLKTDPADLVTECMGLCIAVTHSLADPGPPPTAKLPDIPKAGIRKQSPRNEALLSSDEEALANDTASGEALSTNWRDTQSTTTTAPSPGLHVDAASPSAKRGDTTQSQTVELSSSPRDSHANTSRPSSSRNNAHRLHGFAHAVTRSPHARPEHTASTADHTAALQREVMLLKNDLNFERYLKQQHLAHIGNLHRKSVSEATIASETENLLNTNRTLKARLVKANELYAQLKRETTTSRNQAKKYEDQLSGKLKAYREEEKQWQAEASKLRHDLEKAARDNKQLESLIVESELREQQMRHNLTMLQRDYEDLSALKTQLADAQEALRKAEIKDDESRRAQEEQEQLRTELEALKMEITARDAHLERTKKTYEQRIFGLETRLRMMSTGGTALPGGQLPASVQTMIDSALASSNAKLAALRKAHARLLQKYTDLEVKSLELEAHETLSTTSARSGVRPNSVLSLTRYADDSVLAGTALGRRSSTRGSTSASVRRPHAFSDPSFFDDNSLPEGDSKDADLILPQRFESLSNIRSQKARAMPGTAAVTEDPEPNLPGRDVHDFQISHPTSPLPLPTNRSALSLESAGSGSNGKEKVQPGSQVRVYGRGGAQNIGKKPDAKDGTGKEKKDKPAKSGGFRGLRGIM